MLRHALRRLLWTLPTLIGISLLTFLFLSYVPDPSSDPASAQTLSPEDKARIRRERFLDLPRFFNFDPVGVEERAERAVAAIVDDGPDAAEARRELGRLGGAALPHVLPQLDALSPERRARLALSLAPIARRMGVASSEELTDPARAVAFWSRFWDDRGVEFRRAAVRSAVARLARYGTASRAEDLIELDTLALEDVLEALEPPTDDASLVRARALTEIAAHVTGRDDRIAPGEDLATARACVERWQAYWAVYGSDYVSFAGGSTRIGAVLLETRYGKWALDAVKHRLGLCSGGGTVLDELRQRVPVTLGLVASAIALAYAGAVVLGAVTAARRGHRVDLTIASTVLGLYTIPTAVIAVVLRFLPGSSAHHFLYAVITLALGLVAMPFAQQRSALASALSQEHVTAAVARGASRARAVIFHGVRNALLPVVTLATLEGPMALGGAFVVERVFGLRGVGELTILAVQQRDISWLMALSILAAGISAVLVTVTDLAYAVLDRRLEPAIVSRKDRA